MKKMSEKIHHQFISGKINGAIFNYMQKIAAGVDDTDALIFDKHIKNLVAWNARTEQDCKEYFNIYAKAPRALGRLIDIPIDAEVANVFCKYAFLNRSQYNLSIPHHLSKLVLDFYKEAKDKIKQAHPNNMGIESENPIRNPYNIDKWIETMRYIYNTANTNNLPLDSITKQVTAKWEENERINFQRWMRYYQEGNYNKYNVKTAQFFQNKQEEGKLPDLKPVKDLFDTSAFPKPDPVAEKKKRLDEGRTKLRGRLKSVDELVEKYRDVLPKDIAAIIRKDVYELREKILGLELRASIVDSINRTSNQFSKHGFVEGAKELKKIAQEVAEDKLPAPEGPMETPAPNAEIAPELPEEPKAMAPSGDKSNVRVPEVNIGEEKIEIPDFSSATHRDALQKLEEINKVISERNVVRALAAVDIILGQLGIASYFPQLSEAQSKMMDAFNYAGTRVAETIGQMRGGSGGPIAKTPPAKKEEAVEVSEEVEKPVGEVVSGGPPAAKPTPEIK
jgi:hypothetical protein